MNHPAQANPNTDWKEVAAAARCWSQSGDAYFPVSEVVSHLPPGAYRCVESPGRGPFLDKMPIQIDTLLTLPDSAADQLLAEFKTFWSLKPNFIKRGFTFKRGMLLYGPPGAGKTSAIWQMVQELVKNQQGIVLFAEHPGLATTCISFVRRIEPDRPMVVIMEDIDTLIAHHGEHGFLALLDGETQIANVVYIATTNYFEALDKRFRDRPSRFDTLMKVAMPTEEARKAYLKFKEPDIDDITLERWARRTDEYSIAHLREVIVGICVFERSEDEVFKRLDAMRNNTDTSDGMGGESRPVGFLQKRR